MRNIVFLFFSFLVMNVPVQANDLQVDITVAFNYGDDIYITDFSGDPINITNSDTYEIVPAWSPDGAEIAFLSSESYRTWNESHLNVVLLATGEISQVSDLMFTSETMLTWSPDGRYIAATLGTIFIVDIEAREDWRLPVECGSCYPNWLPDSSGLVFNSRGEIFRIDSDGQNLERITNAPPNAYRPALSPVSNEVVFASSFDHVSGLYIVNIDDLTLNRLVDLSGYEDFPHYWSPDGQYVAVGVSPAYHSDVSVAGGADVYVINHDGTDMRLVTGDGRDSLVGWTNDSEHVIYYEGVPGGASGSYYAVNVLDGTQTRLSDDVMDRMCSYFNCYNIVIRP